jgi:hypothetical protein
MQSKGETKMLALLIVATFLAAIAIDHLTLRRQAA